jgi:hypothetical protein
MVKSCARAPAANIDPVEFTQLMAQIAPGEVFDDTVLSVSIAVSHSSHSRGVLRG